MGGEKRSAEAAGLEAPQATEKRARSMSDVKKDLKALEETKNRLEWELYDHEDSVWMRRDHGGNLVAGMLDKTVKMEDLKFVRRFGPERKMQVTLWPCSGHYAEDTMMCMTFEEPRLTIAANLMLTRNTDEDAWEITVSSGMDWSVSWASWRTDARDDVALRTEQMAKIAAQHQYDDDMTRFLKLLMHLDYLKGSSAERHRVLEVFRESRIPPAPRPADTASVPTLDRCHHCFDLGKIVRKVGDCSSCGNPVCESCKDSAGPNSCKWCEGNMLFE